MIDSGKVSYMDDRQKVNVYIIQYLNTRQRMWINTLQESKSKWLKTWKGADIYSGITIMYYSRPIILWRIREICTCYPGYWEKNTLNS